MAEALGIFDQRVLDGTAETIYTVPINHTFVPKTISITNIHTTNSATVTIYFADISADNKNMVLNKKSVIPGETVFLNTDIYLQAGYKIIVQASASATLNCQLSGVDMS